MSNNLILVRHGASVWNLESRFTGWVDVDLAPKGKQEAVKSGELIKEQKLKIDYFFTSYQKRAIETLDLILNIIRVKNVKVIKAWQLNEKSYGILTGENKERLKEKLGPKAVHELRRSFNRRAEPLSKNSPFHPINISAYDDIPRDLLPSTESLSDCFNRVNPFFQSQILTKLKDNKNILIVAHGNSLRSCAKFLFNLDEKEIPFVEIPTGNPLIIEFNSKNEITKCHYLDQERAVAIPTGNLKI